MLREESNISLSWFSCGSPVLIELECRHVGLSGGKPKNPRKP